jgi:GGDEF domain-containing protein
MSSHFSLLIFDLDFFKRVNDMDTVARYGGEEFVVLLPESNGSETELAERISN